MSHNATADSDSDMAIDGLERDIIDLDEDSEDSDQDMKNTVDTAQFVDWWRSIWHTTPDSRKTTVQGENRSFSYAVTSMQGWRMNMEDTHAIKLHLGDQDGANAYFAVFDGHGGDAIAGLASEFLHQNLVKEGAYAQKAYPEALKNAFLGFDAKFRPYETDGSTATVALITNEGKIYVANTGDSRAVLSHQGKAKPLSLDHKTSIVAEQARVLAAGGRIEDDRVNGDLAMTRSLGDYRLKQNMALPPEQQMVTALPEVVEHEVTKEDEFLILACDGVWDCLKSQQVIDLVRLFVSQGKKLSKVCEDICQHCLAPNPLMGHGDDNMTLMVVALLHGRTPQQWYEWVTKRTVSRHGYDTPKELPEIYPSEEVEDWGPAWDDLRSQMAESKEKFIQQEEDALDLNRNDIKARLKV
ncbi:phosphatase 2C-like domain-containing protein [Sparassis latifolia]